MWNNIYTSILDKKNGTTWLIIEKLFNEVFLVDIEKQVFDILTKP